jgi:DNA polymerase-4
MNGGASMPRTIAARAILHVDMDAFYASVEERDRPELRGRPLIVGGIGGRGVVAAANYAVRRFGVRSAMPMSEARRRCPEAVCVRPRMARYQEVSEQVFALFYEVTPLVEGLSLDEAFLDVTASQRLLGDPTAIAERIRSRIRRTCGLTASVGVAPNKLLAKIASDIDKPDGLCRIGADNLREILDALPIGRLPGIGPKSLPAVLAAGIRTFADLRAAGDDVLRPLFGRSFRGVRDLAAGLDDRPVRPDREEKSISAERTFSEDIREARQLNGELLRLIDRTASRLRARDLVAGRVMVKIRRRDFTTETRQRRLARVTHDTADIASVAMALLDEWLRAEPTVAVRLLGVAAGDLQVARQGDLFAQAAPRESRIDAAVDDIRRRFGPELMTRASLLEPAPDAAKRRAAT